MPLSLDITLLFVSVCASPGYFCSWPQTLGGLVTGSSYQKFLEFGSLLPAPQPSSIHSLTTVICPDVLLVFTDKDEGCIKTHPTWLPPVQSLSDYLFPIILRSRHWQISPLEDGDRGLLESLSQEQWWTYLWGSCHHDLILKPPPPHSLHFLDFNIWVGQGLWPGREWRAQQRPDVPASYHVVSILCRLSSLCVGAWLSYVSLGLHIEEPGSRLGCWLVGF